MKILAIRGNNLASLGGDFAVELHAEPLRSAGLFVITGPTGSGKSTLLDALCLALFDCTPRLARTGGAKIGRADDDPDARITANDVRGLLTRGRGEGWAEVEFLGRDARTYRARWTIQRARRRPDGRLQKQSLTLVDAQTDRHVGGSTKTEVLDAIQEKLGLTFEQFRRSALLAQGDFAAFLHATPGHRADLLERVTGTGIYGRLSMAAFAAAKARKDELQVLRETATRLGILAEDARAAVEARVAAADDAHRAARAAVDSARAAVSWHQDRAQLAGNVEAAERDQQTAADAAETAAPRRELLRRIHAAAPLCAPLDAHDRALEQLARARTDELATRVALVDAEDSLARSRDALVAAAGQRAEASAGREAARSGLDEAGRLDALLGREREGETAALGALADAERIEQEAERLARGAASARAAQERRRADAEAWLAAHPHAEALVAGWAHVDPALRELVGAARQLPALDAELAAAAGARDRAAALRDQRTAELDGARVRADSAREVEAAAHRAVPEGARPALASRRQRLDVEHGHVRAALEAAEICAFELRERDTCLASERDLRGQAVGHRAAAATAEADARECRNTLDALDATIRHAEAARSLDAHRADLADGHPCPLCGSADHPWAAGRPDGALDAGQAERLVLRGRVEQSARAASAGDAAATQLIVRADAVAASAARSDARWKQAAEAYASARFACGFLAPLAPDPAAPDAVEAARRLLASRTADLRALDAEETALTALDAAAVAARKTALDAADAHDTSRTAAARADEAARDAVRAHDAHAQSRAALLLRRDDLRATLARTLDSRPGWPEAVDRDPAAGHAALAREVTDARTALGARDAAIGELAAAILAAVQAAAAYEAAMATATTRRAAHAEATARVAELAVRRAALFEGRPVEAVRGALDAAVRDAEIAHDAAAHDVQGADTARASAQATLDERVRVVRTATAADLDAAVALDAALAEAEVSLEIARDLLARPAAWIDAEQRALEQVDAAIATARAIVGERRSRLADHEASDPPAADAPAAAAGLELALADERAATDAASGVRAELAADDASRARGAELRERLAADEAAAAPWLELDHVIGSADGKKFRSFAQSLTLDALLGHANHHLDTLAPRYRLVRVPGEDLDLQVVDRHMGDEVRAVQSLSGGESFLASLALALGLASLSASDTPVDSLFIDEGFGTLDRETLEIALGALDALQATGRQVGMITHVDGLAEHIGVEVRVRKLGAGLSCVIPPVAR